MALPMAFHLARSARLLWTRRIVGNERPPNHSGSHIGANGATQNPDRPPFFAFRRIRHVVRCTPAADKRVVAKMTHLRHRHSRSVAMQHPPLRGG